MGVNAPRCGRQVLGKGIGRADDHRDENDGQPQRIRYTAEHAWVRLRAQSCIVNGARDIRRLRPGCEDYGHVPAGRVTVLRNLTRATQPSPGASSSRKFSPRRRWPHRPTQPHTLPRRSREPLHQGYTRGDRTGDESAHVRTSLGINARPGMVGRRRASVLDITSNDFEFVLQYHRTARQ